MVAYLGNVNIKQGFREFPVGKHGQSEHECLRLKGQVPERQGHRPRTPDKVTDEKFEKGTDEGDPEEQWQEDQPRQPKSNVVNCKR